MNNAVLLGLGLLFLVYLIYKLFFGRNTLDNEYDKMYQEIMTSDKYKAKGQYEK